MERAQNIISNLQDLITSVEAANTSFGGQVWWRGQRCADWQLAPSVFRDGRGSTDECSAGIRFRQRAISRMPNVPSSGDNFAWLIWMQHHGLPTRLLDWTESPLTAVYFACEGGNQSQCSHGEKKTEEYTAQESALYALSPYVLNKVQVGEHGLLVPEDARVQAVIRPAFASGATEETKILAVRPPELFPRMMAQLSTFTVHSKESQLERVDSDSKFLIQYTIPAEARKDLSEQIKWLGTRSSNLFPDLDHLGEEIKRVRFLPSEGEKDGALANHGVGNDEPGYSLNEAST